MLYLSIGDRRSYVFSDTQRALEIRVRQHDYEFFSTESSGHVHWPFGMHPYEVGNQRQAVIALEMTIVIIELFKPGRPQVPSATVS